MKINVLMTNRIDNGKIQESQFKKNVCGVIDTIRATSTIVTMLACGAKSVIMAGSKTEAFSLKKIFRDHILCGEEGGLAPLGFDYGNSPREIAALEIGGKDFILMTTNGTKSLLLAKSCLEVYALSILNLSYALECMLDSAQRNNCGIIFLCSGKEGNIAYDDAYTAGLAVKYLLTRPVKFDFSDSAKLVLSASLSESDVIGALEKSSSAKALKTVGLGDDLPFLAQHNKFSVAPLLKKSTIKKLNAGSQLPANLNGYSSSDFIYFLVKK